MILMLIESLWMILMVIKKKLMVVLNAKSMKSIMSKELDSAYKMMNVKVIENAIILELALEIADVQRKTTAMLQKVQTLVVKVIAELVKTAKERESVEQMECVLVSVNVIMRWIVERMNSIILAVQDSAKSIGNVMDKEPAALRVNA